jgi:hypothetical protein
VAQRADGVVTVVSMAARASTGATVPARHGAACRSNVTVVSTGTTPPRPARRAGVVGQRADGISHRRDTGCRRLDRRDVPTTS